MSLQNTISEAISYIRSRGEKCATNATLEDLNNAIKLAKGRIGQAVTAGKLAGADSNLLSKLEDANKKLADVSDGISKAREVCIFINEAGRIADAIEILSDEYVMTKNPKRAAEAFDTLFQGIGMICKRLPFPANQWAQFFENFNLFSKMVPLLNPETNPQHRENWQGANERN